MFRIYCHIEHLNDCLIHPVVVKGPFSHYSDIDITFNVKSHKIVCIFDSLIPLLKFYVKGTIQKKSLNV